MLINILLSIIFLIIGFGLAWLIIQRRLLILKSNLDKTTTQLIETKSAIDNLQKYSNDRLHYLEDNIKVTESILVEERKKFLLLTEKLARAEKHNENLDQQILKEKENIEQIQKKFTAEFESLAAKILKQNTIEFSDSNQKKITEILSPLKEKIQQFEKQIHETYEKGLKDQLEIKTELKKLHELNNHISEEAHNLTRALKGDVKKQGNWGEVVLERILERSGLIKGEEYITQFTGKNENGEIIRPDVIIKLPENKHIIVDSKVSLVAYEQYVNADDSEEKNKFARLHIESLRNHIKGLSDKQYFNSLDIPNSPDFVLLFVPIESSFSIALQYDIDLFNFAWDKKVVIVSPSTLLATLKTIESIWKREKQTQNAMEIASEGGKLYDKFVALVDDLKRLGSQLDTVQKTYQEANKKLYSGNGNLIGKVQKLQQLGAKNTKSLPEIAFNPDVDDEML